jgi:hypothetical protein
MWHQILNEYQNLMIQTRWFGLLGALGLLFLWLAEISDVLRSSAQSEVPPSLDSNILDFAYLAIVGLALLFRLFVLKGGAGPRYSLHSASWVAVAFSLIGLLLIWEYKTSPVPSGPCDPETGELCFEIYVLYKTSPLILSTPVFLIASAARSLVTVIIAGVLVRNKHK